MTDARRFAVDSREGSGASNENTLSPIEKKSRFISYTKINSALYFRQEMDTFKVLMYFATCEDCNFLNKLSWIEAVK